MISGGKSFLPLQSVLLYHLERTYSAFDQPLVGFFTKELLSMNKISFLLATQGPQRQAHHSLAAGSCPLRIIKEVWHIPT